LAFYLIVMQQGVITEAVCHNVQRVIEATERKNYRMIGRLQNEIWGASV